MKHEKSIKIILTKNPEGRKRYIVNKYLKRAQKRNDWDTVNENILHKLKKEDVDFIRC